MKVTVYVSILLVVVFSSGYADEPAETPEDSTTEPSPELTPEQLKLLFDELMAREKRGFVIPPKSTTPLEDRPKFSGEWIERDGLRTCDGYLTRVENEDYCAAGVPADWQPFEFDGRTYYIQPLTDEGR